MSAGTLLKSENLPLQVNHNKGESIAMVGGAGWVEAVDAMPHQL
jgi:hypothetical protein